jgi:hypothetical protein
MTHQHNVNSGTITAGGNVQVGDTNNNIYYVTLQQRFQDSHSLLFLRLDPAETGGYTARLSAKNAQTGTIDHYAAPVAVAIPEGLFGQVEAFQMARRSLGQALRVGPQTGLPAQQAEAALTNLLYDTFLAGEIGEAVGQFMALLQTGKLAELLLIVSTDDDALLQLPWELLLPRLGNVPGAMPPDTFGLIRSHFATLDTFAAQGKTDRNGPLKVLFVSALPENIPETAKQLLLENELKALIAVSQNAANPAQPALVIEILDCASLAEMEQALDKRGHDIVHISGHGTYLSDQQQGVLLLEDEDGDQHAVPGHELGQLLSRFKSIKLLVVSACETAAGVATWPGSWPKWAYPPCWRCASRSPTKPPNS